MLKSKPQISKNQNNSDPLGSFIQIVSQKEHFDSTNLSKKSQFDEEYQQSHQLTQNNGKELSEEMNNQTNSFQNDQRTSLIKKQATFIRTLKKNLRGQVDSSSSNQYQDLTKEQKRNRHLSSIDSNKSSEDDTPANQTKLQINMRRGTLLILPNKINQDNESASINGFLDQKYFKVFDKGMDIKDIQRNSLRHGDLLRQQQFLNQTRRMTKVISVGINSRVQTQSQDSRQQVDQEKQATNKQASQQQFINNRRKASTTNRMDEENQSMYIHNLPARQVVEKKALSNTPFLKMYQCQNGIHDGDRERAQSVMANLHMPLRKKQQMGKFNYIFNKKQLKEEKSSLAQSKLMELGQLSEQQFETFRNKQAKKSAVKKFLDKQGNVNQSQEDKKELFNKLVSFLNKDQRELEEEKKKLLEKAKKQKEARRELEILEKEQRKKELEVVERKKNFQIALIQIKKSLSSEKKIHRRESSIFDRQVTEQGSDEDEENKNLDDLKMSKQTSASRTKALHLNQNQHSTQNQNELQIPSSCQNQIQELQRKQMIDKSIIKASQQNEKVMNYYFDKFNVKLKDLNPFTDQKVLKLESDKKQRTEKDEYSLTQRNLSRMMLNRQYNQRKLNNMQRNSISKLDKIMEHSLLGHQQDIEAYEYEKMPNIQERTFNNQSMIVKKQNSSLISFDSPLKVKAPKLKENLLYKTQQQFNETKQQRILGQNIDTFDFSPKQDLQSNPYTNLQNPSLNRYQKKLPSPDKITTKLFESLSHRSPLNHNHRRSKSNLNDSQYSNTKHQTSQEIRDKVTYNNKGFLYKDQILRQLHSRNQSQTNRNISTFNQTYHQNGFNSKMNNSFFANKSEHRNTTDKQKQICSQQSAFDNKFTTNNASALTIRDQTKQGLESSSHLKNLSQQYYQSGSSQTMQNKHVPNQFSEISQQYMDLRKDFNSTYTKITKTDKKSRRLMTQLKKVLQKQKVIEQNIDLQDARGDLDEYFDNKMKVFCLNEQRRVDFNKQKLDYIINRKLI
eukprot:403376328